MKRITPFVVAATILLATTGGTLRSDDFSIDAPAAGAASITRVDDLIVRGRLMVEAWNYTGKSLRFRTVVTLDTGASCPSGSLCVRTATTSESKKVIGVVGVGGSDQSTVQVIVSGPFAVDVTGTVAKGDFLKLSSTEDGKAMSAGSDGQDAFALAITDTDLLPEGVDAIFTVVDTY